MGIKNPSLKTGIIITILVLISGTIGIYVYGTYFADATEIPTEGTVQTTAPLLLADPPLIDWGTITVYSSTTKTVTFTNNSTESELITDLTFETTNWQNTSDLGLTLDWDYGGTDIYAKQSIAVTFTLTSTALPEDITASEFSFDIVITPTVEGEAP